MANYKGKLMQYYQNITFCSANCSTECSRKLTDQVKADAKLWWGSDYAPIAVANFELDCDDYTSKETIMIYYRHFRDISYPITLAMEIKPDSINIGWAQCSSKDQFSRAEGRRIAQQRLIDKPVVVSLKHIKAVIINMLQQQRVFTKNKFEAVVDGCLPQHFNTELLFNVALLELVGIDYKKL